MNNMNFGELIGKIYNIIEVEIGSIPDSCYISGSISKNPNAKKDFEKASIFVAKKYNLTPINPIAFAEKHGLIGNDKNMDYYSKIMLIDFMLVKFCKNIFMMKNWQTSKGAYNEHNFAISLGKNVIYEAKTFVKYKYNQHIVNSFNELARHLETSPANLKKSKLTYYLVYKLLLMYALVRDYKYDENYISTILNYDRSSVYNAVKSSEQFLQKRFERELYNNVIIPIVTEEYIKLMSRKEDEK